MNGRKARQLRSQGGQKRLRRNKKAARVTAAEHNAAMEAINAELEEARQYQEEVVAKLQAEPQFLVLDPFTGRPIMQVAESMLFPIPQDEPAEAAPQIVLPEGVEA